MAKAYKRLRRQRTERRLKNQSFMEPSKRPATGKRKKSFIRSLFSRDASELGKRRPATTQKEDKDRRLHQRTLPNDP
jgi:hypothetical protein